MLNFIHSRSLLLDREFDLWFNVSIMPYLSKLQAVLVVADKYGVRCCQKRVVKLLSDVLGQGGHHIADKCFKEAARLLTQLDGGLIRECAHLVAQGMETNFVRLMEQSEVHGMLETHPAIMMASTNFRREEVRGANRLHFRCSDQECDTVRCLKDRLRSNRG